MRGSTALLDLLFRLVTLAFPAGLRAEVGVEMREAFRETVARHRRQRGVPGAAVFVMRSVVDVVRAGLGERVRRRGGRNPGRRGKGMFRELGTDIRHGIRRLRRAPAFSLTAAGLLALGIGANTAGFSALRAALLAPLPYPEPEQLVWLDLRLGATAAEANDLPWSWRKFGLLAADADDALAAVSGYGVRTLTLSGTGADPVRLTVEVVAPAYFETLRVVPALGRGFSEEEQVENGPPALILGHAEWRDRFGADPAVLGTTVQLNDRPVLVVGIAPPGFGGLSGAARAWLPATAAGQLISPVMLRSQAHWIFGFGRLATGVDAETVGARLAGVAEAVRTIYPLEAPDEYAAIAATPLDEVRANPASRASLLLLMAAAAMVLVITCANLAGLLLARSRARSRDAAIRLSLGAGRARVVRAGLVEALLLAGAGGLAGTGFAWWALETLRSVWPRRFLSAAGTRGFGLPLRSMDVELFRLDPTALAFAAAATLLTGVLFGVLPALRAARVPVQETLRDGSGATRRRGSRRGLPSASSVLIAAQTALALVLLVGAALMLRTLVELRRVPAGFDTSNMLVMDLTIPRASPLWENPLPLRDRIRERLGALPAVESATFGCPPLSGPCWTAGVSGLDGREVEMEAAVGVHAVPDNYFETLRVPLLSGRTFGAADQAGSPPVVVLNVRAARTLFGSDDPIGRSVALTVELTTEGRQAEVIGVVGDVLQGRPEAGPAPEAYFTERQMTDAMALMVRTRGEPLDAVTPVRAALRDLAPDMVVDRVRTMGDTRRGATGETRTVLLLLGLFAVTAVVLAGAGIWAVVALAVAERRRELGLRMALGAHAGRIVGTVVRQGMAAAVVGAVVGAWAAWGLSRLLAGLLFNTRAHEPLAYVGALVVLLLGAGVASLIPARHATRVDPARVLRAD